MLIRNSALYLAANGVSAVLGFAGVFLYTRLLDPADFGVFVIGNTVAGIVSALMFTWLRHSTIRFQSEGTQADIRLSALVGYGGILALMPFAFLALIVIGRLPWQTAAIAILISASMGLFDLSQDILRARQLASRAMLGVMARAAISLAVGLLAIAMGAGGVGLLIALSCAYIAAAFLLAPATWQPPRRAFSAETLRQMLLFGGPITASGFLFALHSGLDRLLIGHILGADAAGQYGASADFVRQCLIYPAISASAAIGPLAIQLYAQDGPDSVNPHLARSAELLLAVVLPAAVGLALTSADLSTVVLGPKFRDAGATLMPIFAMSWIGFVIAHHYAHLSFSLANKPSLYIIHAAGTLAISGALMVPMIRSYGLVGAALSLMIAECLSAVIGLVLSRQAHPLPLPTMGLLRVVGAVAIMAFATLAAQAISPDNAVVRLVLAISVGGLSYSAAVVAINVLNVRPFVITLVRRWRTGAPQVDH
jgi:O-antigen/teichoic acid export membrane protein